MMEGTYARAGGGFVFTPTPLSSGGATVFMAQASGDDVDSFVLRFEAGAPLFVGEAHRRLPCIGAVGSSTNY